MLMVIKNWVKFYDMTMINKTLDFYLLNSLLNNFLLNDLWFFDDFDRKNHPCLFVSESYEKLPCDDDPAKLSLS